LKGSKKISRQASRPSALFLFSAALILLALTGCSIKNTRNTIPYPQEIVPAATDIKTPDSITAMLRFSSKRTGLKGRAALTIKSPDLIRVEIYGAMGQILTVIAGDSKGCKVYKKGVITECSWSEPEISGLITPGNLVPVLLGRGKLAFQDSKQRQSFLDNYGRLTQIVASRDSNPERDSGLERGLDPEQGLDLERGADPEQGTDLERGINLERGLDPEWGSDPERGSGAGGLDKGPVSITIGDYRIVGGLRIPFSFVVRDGKEVLTLQYYSLTPNPEIARSLFSLGATGN